ncbi:CAP domain-containing protein [Dimargaris cristalligena]|uniref:CAP domain-containing protein n=1 Tax=Dimargaris cristalligena TaxID=215637 RepID=A0A4Q0A1Q6_9FUNG|nr:CAP domain-containing protein [Dimargaris cristalligena]|eukprot:RKP39090.1 CAP domain-containing protein [Dimargaris cristalligena]
MADQDPLKQSNDSIPGEVKVIVTVTVIAGVPTPTSPANEDEWNLPRIFNSKEPTNITLNEPNSELAQAQDLPLELPNLVGADNAVGVVLEAVNQARAKLGLQPTIADSDLTRVAQAHSDYQKASGKMTHDDPQGSADQRLSRIKPGWDSVAENVAMGYPDPTADMEAWMKSPGHRANILNPDSIRMGYARSGKYSTQMFAHYPGDS